MKLERKEINKEKPIELDDKDYLQARQMQELIKLLRELKNG